MKNLMNHAGSDQARVFYTYMESPVGRLLLAGTRHALLRISFSQGRMARGVQSGWEPFDEPFRQVQRQLEAYFDGRRTSFELPLAAAGTDFQRSVWRALLDIPYGQTRSYGDLARAIDRPRAVRAVGAANGCNPLPIVVPCHRVIGAGGQLTGFGGGLPAKRYLLDLERRHSGLLAGV